MNRPCALRWAATLALVATVAMAPLPARLLAPNSLALAQETSAVDAGEPADLAIAALHCAEAPAAEALTAFFATGETPGGCSPAVGVTVAVSEDDAPIPGSPAATDINGIAVLPVSLGSAVEVREDPASLPDGYAPLTQEANGVPYANPVTIDAAVAGAAVLFVNVPSAATELAQAGPASDVGEAADLAVVALQCAAAPGAETLTAFFRGGTPPGGCAPSVGVRVSVTENGQPLADSPFTTDADGALSVPVGLGAVVSVTEDPRSLPTGYAPLTHAANGVPYANPVQLDAATADTAVLFVNVPKSLAAAPDRSGCDPAYPDTRTCIAPGRPLAVPCTITDQRNFTVLAPDPRGLDADHDGIGCEPIAPAGGSVARTTGGNRASSGSTMRRAAPAVAANRVRSDTDGWESRPETRRVTTPDVNRDRANASLWYAAPTRTGTGNVAVVSHPTFIANGVWCWPDRSSRDDWVWRQRNPYHDGVRFLPNNLHINNLAFAGSGSGNVAIVSNPVFISNGLWAWPARPQGDDWAWRNRPGLSGWVWGNRSGNGGWGWGNHSGNGGWSWPNWLNPGQVTVASSGHGTGSIAVVSNPVFIGSGVWRWPGHMNAGGWPGIISTGNLVIARSGNNLAIVSNPVVIIASGLWYVPPARNNDHDWYDHRDNDDGDHHDGSHGDGDHDDGDHRGSDRDDADVRLMQGGSAPAGVPAATGQAIEGGSASEAQASEIEPLLASTPPALTVNGGLAVELAPADATQPPGSDTVASPTASNPAASDVDVALPSEGTGESPADGAGAAPGDTATQPQPAADAPAASYVAPDPGYVAPDSGYVAPDPGYVAPDPAVDAAYVDPSYVDPGYVDPGYTEQAPIPVDAGADTGYVAPEPSDVEPVYAAPDAVDPGYVAPDPVFAPSPSEPQPGAVDPGFAVNDVQPGANTVMPEPVSVAPEPGVVDSGNSGASSGMDAGFGGQDSSTSAPEPNIADSGFGDAGSGNAGAMAPEPGMNDVGNGDSGVGATDFGGDGGG